MSKRLSMVSAVNILVKAVAAGKLKTVNLRGEMMDEKTLVLERINAQIEAIEEMRRLLTDRRNSLAKKFQETLKGGDYGRK